jgi:hypothetical protein
MKASTVSAIIELIAKGGDRSLVFACHLWMSFLCNVIFWFSVTWVLYQLNPPSGYNGNNAEWAGLWLFGWGISGLPIMTVALTRRFGRMGR